MTKNANPDATAESPVEGTEASGMVEGTEVVSQAAYDALKAQFDNYRQTLLATSQRYTSRHGWCREVGSALREIDPVLKAATFGGSAEVTLKLRVELTQSAEEITDDRLWGALGDLAYELGTRKGVVERVPGTLGTVEIVEPFTVVRMGLAGLAEYVTPEEFQAREEARQNAENLAKQESGAYGQCVKCGKNVNRRYDCTNEDCSLCETSDDDD